MLCGCKWTGSDHFFAALNVTQTSGSDNTSSSVATGTLECFSEAFWSNSTAESERANEVVDKVRLVLLSQAAVEASSALHQQTESHDAGDDGRQAKYVEIVDAIFNSTRTLLEMSARNTLQTLSSMHLHGRDDDGDQDNLSSDAKSPWAVVPVAVPDLKVLDELENLKQSLQTTLTTVFPAESAVVEKILNASAIEWGSLEHHMQALEEQKTILQIELQRVANATWGQLNRSAVTTRAMLVLTELEVVATIKDLNQQWNAATHKMIDSTTRSWQAIEQRIRPFTSEMALHMAPFKTRSHCRELEIDDFSREDAFAQRQYALVQRRKDLQFGPAEDDGDGNSDSQQQQNPDFGAGSVGVRVRALVSAGFEMWRSVRRLLLAADWSYACLQIFEVVIELWTDSYSGMASIDIREISSIQDVVRCENSPALGWLVSNLLACLHCHLPERCVADSPLQARFHECRVLSRDAGGAPGPSLHRVRRVDLSGTRRHGRSRVLEVGVPSHLWRSTRRRLTDRGSRERHHAGTRAPDARAVSSQRCASDPRLVVEPTARNRDPVGFYDKLHPEPVVAHGERLASRVGEPISDVRATAGSPPDARVVDADARQLRFRTAREP